MLADFILKWRNHHLKFRNAALEKRCAEAEGRFNFWIQEYHKMSVLLNNEKNRTEKLLRKLAYYRRKIKNTQSKDDKTGEDNV